MKSGYDVWGAPAIRSSPDNYYLTRWQNHFNNIRDFVPYCKESGYKGMIMTSWSTSGVYSPVYESEDHLVDLVALRHVYPITGFNLLIAAYTKAITLKGPLNITQFISGYCHTHYGFNEGESLRFQKAIVMAPYTISDGKVDEHQSITIKNLLDSAQLGAGALHTLQPKKNTVEFANFQLMADIRVFYLSYMLIESGVNDDLADRTIIAVYLSHLKILINQEPGLNKRFIALNQDVLFPAAITEENNLRNQKIDNLYNRLAGLK